MVAKGTANNTNKYIENPSKTKLYRYIALKIINAYEEGIDFQKLQELSDIQLKHLLIVINRLLYWGTISKSKRKYIANGKGKKLLKYYEDVYGAKDWYKFMNDWQRSTLERIDNIKG